MIENEINLIEKEIDIYGENYIPNNYNLIVSSVNSKTSNTYYTNVNSFVKDISSNDENISLGTKLENKKKENNLIETDINYYKEEINRIKNLENIVFDSNDVTKLSNITVRDAQIMLEGTNLYDLAEYFVEAEQTYEVNAIFIMSICALESGWGTSHRAMTDNNLTGLGVYSDSSTGLNSDTKRDNILLTTKILKENYLTPSGPYYNGVSTDAVNQRYCVTPTWGTNTSNIGNKLYNKLMNYETKLLD